MPSLLNYAVMTDPTSLEASQPGVPSVGTVYVIVSNTHQSEVKWEFIDVEIPVGSGPSDLTGNPTAISASVEKGYSVWREEDPTFGWDSTLGRFRAHAPSGGKLTLPDGESLILTLENIPVSDLEGPVRLKIRERSGGGDDNIPIRRAEFTTTLGVVKQAPRIPRNFRPENNSLVDVDAGQNVVLRWDGPDNLDYWIRDPQGNEVLVQSAAQGPRVTQRPYTWSPPSAPKRGTTYTLIAGSTGAGQQRQGYFLTTTVHALVPEFDSGTRTPWVEGTPSSSRVTFSAGGVEVRNGTGGWGTVTAGTVDVDRVNTESVHGRDSDDGWVDFPKSGLHVHRDGQPQLGVLSAGAVDVDRVDTGSVHGRNSDDGWLDFPKSGVQVRDGQNDLGTVKAGKADLDDLLTGQGRVKGHLVVQGGMKVSDGSERALEADGSGVTVHNGLSVSGGGDIKGVLELHDGIYVHIDELNYISAGVGMGGVEIKGCLAVTGTILAETDTNGRKV
ncbi:hypothetical protein [Saccharothrix sp. ST-888]|uniref:hypothetical protein n=1 Tax=Saccharothrix sp. ST-888 TaxID=1427391 RepID=UPI0005ED0696|nr:hypothetical protein [Saccharothrix sp. ST-888]KJK54924.1 hypothetical protein UK12_31930 [Saccharothrix sp. ST-888]